MEGHDLRHRMLAFIGEHNLLEPDQRVLVGVSGGVDSIVLLHLLRHDFEPVVAHVDHGLRSDSGDDGRFVQQLAEAWRLEGHVVEVEVEAGASRQGQARRARYAALDRLAAELELSVVAVAHQRDDVAETLLLQLVRGAGPRGWRAFPIARPLRRGSRSRLIRPLRFASRYEIEAYAREHRLEWREDPSNALLTYRRSAMRKKVIPMLKKHFGEGVPERLAAAAELAEAYVESGAALAPSDAMREAQQFSGALRVEALRGLPRVVRRGVILEVLAREFPAAVRSAGAAARVEKLLEAQPGKRVELGGITVWREHDVLRFTIPNRPAAFVAPLAVPGTVESPWGRLSARVRADAPGTFGDDRRIELVDHDLLGDALLVRTWMDGDRLAPMGMSGTKLVSDLLTERRVPSSQRAQQLVLTSGDEVVWVVGHRLGRRFALSPHTSRVVELRWEPSG